MAARNFDVSPVTQAKAAQLGAPGTAWLQSLPDLVLDLESRWSLTVGEPIAGGSAALVAEAWTATGEPAVLKLSMPDPLFPQQVATLTAARGHGYARVLAFDQERSAVLLERLGSPMERVGLEPEAQIRILCAMLKQAWKVPRSAGGEPTNCKAASLGDLVSGLSRTLRGRCSQRVLAQALTYAERLAASVEPGRSVVVHGDPHPGNALQVLTSRGGAEAGFVFVDPDGFVDDPAYDVGVVLRDWCPQLSGGDAAGTARRYCRLLARHSGVNAARIWEWGYLERVSTGLYLLALGAEEHGRLFLETAELLSEH